LARTRCAFQFALLETLVPALRIPLIVGPDN
jgi:hypothetical protein